MHTDTESAFELQPPKCLGISVYTVNMRLGTHLTLRFLIPAWSHSSSTSANTDMQSTDIPISYYFIHFSFLHLRVKDDFFYYSQMLMAFSRGKSHMHTRNCKRVLGISKGLSPLCYQKQAAHKDLRQSTLIAGQLR